MRELRGIPREPRRLHRRRGRPRLRSRGGQIRRAAGIYAKGNPSAIFYTLGITEHTCGTENVQNMANLAMLCGQIGKRSSGVNPLRGQNNVQGGCDMGAIHSVLPGYQKVADPTVRGKFAKAWGAEIPTHPGGRVTDFIEKAHEGVVKGFYVFGEDPVASEPNQDKVIESLKRLEFLVVQEIFMTETAKLAHVILPATCFAEKDGTFTNSERRVQRVRKAVEPPGEARPDWQIICEVSTAMGYKMSYSGAAEIFAEMASLTPSFAGISYERIEKTGLQWPCPTKDHLGTVFLHEGRFTRGNGLMHADPVPSARRSAGRRIPLHAFHRPNALPLQYRQHDAQKRGDQPEGRREFRRNARGRCRSARHCRRQHGAGSHAPRIARGSCPRRRQGPFRRHLDALSFCRNSTNRLTNDAFDNVTRTAEYKCCAAKVEKAEALES